MLILLLVAMALWAAGFLLLLWLMRRPAGKRAGKAGSLSIIIPARNEAHNLPRLLRSIAGLEPVSGGTISIGGRQVNDLEYRARHTVGHEAARAFLTEWLKDIGYEQHLYDGEDSEQAAASRWSNVMDFCEWMAQRCGGQIPGRLPSRGRRPPPPAAQVAATIPRGHRSGPAGIPRDARGAPRHPRDRRPATNRALLRPRQPVHHGPRSA